MNEISGPRQSWHSLPLRPAFALELGLGEPEREEQGCHAEALAEADEVMTYVCIPQSTAFPEWFYAGITQDLKSRLKNHNAGEVLHTAKISTVDHQNYFAFQDAEKRMRLKNI